MSTSTTSRTVVPLGVWSDPGLRFAAAHAVLIAVLLGCAIAHLGLSSTAVLAVVAIAWIARRLPGPLRPVLGVITWAFITGFVVHAGGVLSFAPADNRRLLLVVASVWVLSGLLAALRRTSLPDDRR